MTSTTRRRVAWLAFGGIPLLAACGSLLPGSGPPPQLFVPKRKLDFSPTLPKVNWGLIVGMPVAPAEIDTTQIALSRTPYTVDYFANAAWPDRAPAMVQAFLVDAFDDSRKIGSVGRESAGLQADYLLASELRHFQADYQTADGPPTVTVRIVARLVKLPDRVIIAEHREEQQQLATRNEMEPIIAAFAGALGQALQNVVVWTLTVPGTQAGMS
jgi:cholesterol transport system auxiliary component